MEDSIGLQGPCADQSSDGFGLLIMCGQPIGAARIPAVLCVSADTTADSIGAVYGRDGRTGRPQSVRRLGPAHRALARL
jgi:hypothetical protein